LDEIQFIFYEFLLLIIVNIGYFFAIKYENYEFFLMK